MMRALGPGDYHMNFYEVHETTHSVYMVIEFIKGGELIK
jgi:hypothetical protein